MVAGVWMITVIKESSIVDFKRDVEPFLRQDVMKNILCLRLITSIEDGMYDEFHLFKVMNDDQVIAVAMQTPPHNLVLSMGTKAAIEALARHIQDQHQVIPGVNGLAESTSAFAQAFNMNDAILTPKLGLQYYVLDQIAPLRPVTGAVRRAGMHDLDLITDWTVDFAIEAGLHVHEQQRNPERITKKIEAQEIFIWMNDGQPIAYVGHSLIIPGLMSVGPVYTPPEFRKRGFGSACTAAVAQIILSRGARAVLCADMANLTSNKIYQEIGFNPTVQYQEYRFA
jgi:uncharacterized protein